MMLFQISLAVICAGFVGSAVAVGGMVVSVLVGVMGGACVSFGAGGEVGTGGLGSTAV